MKIVHIVMSMLYGGSERLATDLAYSMQNAGNEVYVLALSKMDAEKGYDKTEKGKKLTIFYIDKKRGLDLKAIKQLNVFLTKINPDVVHTHIDSAIYVIPWETFNRNVVKVHTVHNQVEKEFGIAKRNLMKVAYGFLRVTPVAISDQIQASIMRVYNLKKQNVPVIYNGIDVKKFQNKKDQKTSHRQLQILHVGRFFEQKNHKFMIQAIKELVDRKFDFHMTFVGEGPLFDDIVEYSKSMKISKYITFAGSTNFVEKFYEKADLFVLPSLFEGLPLSLLEAYAAGLPVIVSDVGGVSDICRDGVNGRLISVDNLNEFVDAVMGMENKEIRDKYGEYNAKFIKNYDVDVVATRYIELYSSLNKLKGVKRR